MTSEDFSVSLEVERHDLEREAQQVADDAVEASPEHKVALALDVLDDAGLALTQAEDAYAAALAAFNAAREAEAQS